MLNNKKGIELPVNFIVLLILAIAVFGAGLKITLDTFNQATELKDELDSQLEQELLSYLSSGKLISVGVDRKVIKEKGSTTFGLGMINKYGKTIYVAVFVTDLIGVGIDNEKLVPKSDPASPGPGEYDGDLAEWTFVRRPNINDDINYIVLKNNEKTIIPLAFRVPAGTPDGLYAFTIAVYYNDTQPTPSDPIKNVGGTGVDSVFEKPQRIYLEVKG